MKMNLRAALLSAAMLTRAATDLAPPENTPEHRGAPPPASGKRSVDASVVPSTYNAEKHTVEVVMSAGTRVQRWYGAEELAIEPDAIDLTRVSGGVCKLLDSHNAYEIEKILGSVIAARIEGGKLIGVLQFALTEKGQAAEGMVARGELTAVSIGYQVKVWRNSEILNEGTANEMYVWRADQWTLLECSFVSVPADPNAVVRSAVPQPGNNTSANSGDALEESEDMHKRNAPGSAPAVIPAQPAAAVEPVRAAEPVAAAPVAAAPAPAAVTRFDAVSGDDFMNSARSFGLATEARTLLEQNGRGEISSEAARIRLLELATERQRSATAPAGGAARVISDETEVTRASIEEALFARATNAAPTDRARQYTNLRMLEMAVRVTPGLARDERDARIIIRAANSTGDFPNLLANVANKILLARYTTATPTYQAIAGRRDLKDFKQTSLLRIGDFPTLQPYAEGGEIKSGTVNEGKETVILGSYGRVLRLTRQAIVNDDLSAFEQMFANMGTMISLFENATFMTMKAQNSGNGPKLSDTVNLFNASHNNLAGSGAAISVASLGVGRAAIRKQKNLDGNVLNLNPTILFVGADKETEAQQQVTAVTPKNASDVNPFGGQLTVVTDGSVAGNAWELYADPKIAPAFVYGFLQDAPGPKVFSGQEIGFDGMSWQVTEDFYAGAIDYRPAYRNPGA